MAITLTTETKRLDHYYCEGIASNHPEFSEVAEIEIGFRPTGFMIIIDGTDPNQFIEWSNKQDKKVDGKITCEDKHQAFDWSDVGARMWVRGPSNKNVPFRVYAWERQR